MAMADLDAFKVLQRADTRWARRRKDDPAPDTYLRHLLAALEPLLAPGTAPIDLDQATELDTVRTELVKATGALNEARGERNDLCTENARLADQLAAVQVDLDETRERLLGHLKAAADDVEAGRIAFQATLEQLGRLVDAINEEWHPDGDHNTQVDRALLLVAAAATQLDHRADTGQHVHTYPRDPRTGRVTACECGHRLSKTVRAGLVAAGKGAA